MKTQAFNPYLPSWEYIPDGEPRVFGNRLYIYGSHDRFGGGGFCLNDYTCWSAPADDLGDWRKEGVIYSVSEDPLNQDGKNNGYAPDVVQGPDGRYYLYYALHLNTVISVAVCDTPAGSYRFYGHVRYADGKISGQERGDINNFDPGVLVDEDGSVHLYTGFAPKGMMKKLMEMRGKRVDGCYHMELEQDMLTVKKGPEQILKGAETAQEGGYKEHAFFEASSMRKMNGTYYLIYSSIQSHELCYCTAPKPEGPFTWQGTLVSIGDLGMPGNEGGAVNYLGNTHGSIVQVNGKWYVFYHRQTNCHPYSRQGCAERVEILPDGRIAQAEMTSCGLNDGPLKGRGRYEARIACNLSSDKGCCSVEKEKKAHHPYFTQSGPDREGNGDQYIANLRDGFWAGFKYFEFDGENFITVRVRGNGKGRLAVSTQRVGGAAAEIPVDPGEDWTEFSSGMEPLHGKQALYFTFYGSGSVDFMDFEIKRG